MVLCDLLVYANNIPSCKHVCTCGASSMSWQFRVNSDIRALLPWETLQNQAKQLPTDPPPGGHLPVPEAVGNPYSIARLKTPTWCTDPGQKRSTVDPRRDVMYHISRNGAAIVFLDTLMLLRSKFSSPRCCRQTC